MVLPRSLRGLSPDLREISSDHRQRTFCRRLLGSQILNDLAYTPGNFPIEQEIIRGIHSDG